MQYRRSHRKLKCVLDISLGEEMLPNACGAFGVVRSAQLVCLTSIYLDSITAAQRLRASIDVKHAVAQL